MVHVHDPIEPRLEQVALPTIPPLSSLGRIESPSAASPQESESRPSPPINLQENPPQRQKTDECDCLAAPKAYACSTACENFTGDE
jgi:hypothetical protein